jgi:hypothetical protein
LTHVLTRLAMSCIVHQIVGGPGLHASRQRLREMNDLDN